MYAACGASDRCDQSHGQHISFILAKLLSQIVNLLYIRQKNIRTINDTWRIIVTVFLIKLWHKASNTSQHNRAASRKGRMSKSTKKGNGNGQKAMLELDAIDNVRKELAKASLDGLDQIAVREIHSRLMSLYASLDINNVSSIIQRIDFKKTA